jgi:uncharacterized protein (TIGR01777 family)
MKIIVAGGTGFVGSALVPALLERGHEVALLARDPARLPRAWRGRVQAIQWDGLSVGEWARGLEGADAVINLAGENIAARRWSAARKQRLLNSRVLATRAIVDACARCAKVPRMLLNASAVGFYGDAGDAAVDEFSPTGEDFLASVCKAWEAEAKPAEALGARVVLLRLGVVLGSGGGALKKMALPFKLFAGGPLGSGAQWLSWVHLDDVVGAVIFALSKESLAGPVNVTAPAALRNRDFSAALARALGRPSWAPAPAFALRAALGEMADMLLTGQRASPRRLMEAGYRFKHESLDEALASCFHPEPPLAVAS